VAVVGDARLIESSHLGEPPGERLGSGGEAEKGQSHPTEMAAHFPKVGCHLEKVGGNIPKVGTHF
jgi:hypothetical protein